MNRDVITDQLRQQELLSVENYQEVDAMKFHVNANKYLLQLIKSQPREYLDGLKDALIKAGQDTLLEFLP